MPRITASRPIARSYGETGRCVVGRSSGVPPKTRSLRSLQVFWEEHPTPAGRLTRLAQDPEPQKLKERLGYPPFAFS